MRQKDLFGINDSAPSMPFELPKGTFLQRRTLTLRLDQALVAVIVLLVFYALVFSLGFEKGKSHMAERLAAVKSLKDSAVRETSKTLEALVSSTSVPVRIPFAEAIRQRGISLNPAGISSSEEMRSGQSSESGSSQLSVSKESSGEYSGISGIKKFSEGKYTIQWVTYKQKEIAFQEIERLSQKGYRGFIVPSGQYLLVCVNQFSSRQKANIFLKDLKGQGVAPPDAFVRNMPHHPA